MEKNGNEKTNENSGRPSPVNGEIFSIFPTQIPPPTQILTEILTENLADEVKKKFPETEFTKISFVFFARTTLTF